MNDLDPWTLLLKWMLHGEGAQLSDKELEERMRYPDGLRELVEKVMGEKR